MRPGTRGGKDRDALIGSKLLQLRIPGHEVVHPVTHSSIQYQVILGVGRDALYVAGNRPGHSLATQQLEGAGCLVRRHPLAEIRLLQGASQLAEDRLRDDERKRAGSPPTYDLAGRASGD